MKIGIIGMGVAGVSVLHAMTKFSVYEEHEIVLFDVPKTFGTGLPYQPDSPLMLLNQTAETMSLKKEDRDDFSKWAERKKGYSNPGKEHLPRPWYGEYMRETVAEAEGQLHPRIVKEQVIDLSFQQDSSFLVQTASQQEQIDLLHLCVGHLPYQDPYQLLGNQHFVYHPYPVEEKIANIPNGSRVGIIGTGLTGIDIMRYLKYQKKGIQLHVFSDTGTFSTLRGDEPDLTLRSLTLERLEREKSRQGGLVSLETMLAWYQEECEHQQVDWQEMVDRFGKGTKEQLENQLADERELGILQSIIHHMDDYLPEYWQALTELDKQHFNEEYRSTFEIIRSPIPRETVQELLRWWQKGEIQVRGEMESVNSSATGFTVHFQSGNPEKVDYLINATGQEKNVSISNYQSDLVNQALNKRLLQPEHFGGVQVMWPTSQALSQRYGIIENLYIHGQMIHGLQYGNNTAGMLRDHAHQVVEQIAQKIK